MKNKIRKLSLILLLFILNQSIKAQGEIKMTINYGVENKDLQTILMFENIDFETITFDGNLKNKDYQINIHEFKNGELVKIDTIFDSSESEYFKIKENNLKFNLISKNQNNNLIIQIKWNGFSSKKLIYKTFPDNGEYVLKNFLGRKNSINVPVGKEFPIAGIITPTVHNDGSASYCEVAQSGELPENLGKKFNIPHYFLIQMKLK